MADAFTIDDVARRAGVSVATVSRALRGLPHVSPSTRARVERIAEELDYRPNPHASRLAAGRSGTIGIVVPVLNSWYYGNVLAGMHSVLSSRGVDLHLLVVEDEEGIHRLARSLPSVAKRVDGLIICDLIGTDVLWNELVIRAMPVVTLGFDTSLFDAVRIDNEASAKMAVNHLLRLGHRRIGFIGGGDDEPLPFPTGDARRSGWVQALRAHGIEPDSALDEAGGFRVALAESAMRRLLDAPRPPTAVFAASDEMAIGAMSALRHEGLDVPNDVSIVGFDDHLLAAASGLTTVHQPVVEMGAASVERLIARLEGDDGRPDLIEAPTRLIVRETTAPPAGSTGDT